MYAVISPEKIYLPPGSVIRMEGNWQDYCVLQESRGDDAIPRLKFRRSEVLLMSPLPRHGREAHLLARVVEILLESESRNYEAFTPITMKIPESGGIEPDYCFYIEQWQAVVGKDRLNWQVDPPPDVVIEIDVTNYTAVEDYVPYRVPEVWLLRKRQLVIYVLQENTYQQQSHSRYFPGVNLTTWLAQVLQQAAEQGSGAALKLFRQQVS
ncbi:MAG: Uma2 family endonuclease [Cyanobacteria bacterium P01_G01_bin.54]